MCSGKIWNCFSFLGVPIMQRKFVFWGSLAFFYQMHRHCKGLICFFSYILGSFSPNHFWHSFGLSILPLAPHFHRPSMLFLDFSPPWVLFPLSDLVGFEWTYCFYNLTFFIGRSIGLQCKPIFYLREEMIHIIVIFTLPRSLSSIDLAVKKKKTRLLSYAGS